jgi:hypothetical protein
MQFTVVALAALATVAAAGSTNETVVYTTEVHTAYTTVCPEATSLTFNGVTYTVSESTTLTITNCPCTIVKPITTSSVVAPSSTPVYANTTTVATSAPVVPYSTTKTAVGTTSVKASATPTPSTIAASSGNKAFAFSGASLAGVLGLAAYFL